MGVPVLMYHALEDREHPSGYTDPSDKVYVVQVEQFRRQMEFLRENGFRTCLVEELLEWGGLPEKTVVLTFDDGHESNFTLALPILQEFGFKAEFFITTAWIGTPHFLTRKQIRELAHTGMGIGSHGVTHRYLDDLSDGEIEKEMLGSHECLEKILGTPTKGISFPGGRSPKCGNITCSAYYDWGASSRIGLFDGKKLYDIPRVAMKHNTCLADFKKIVGCDRTFYLKAMGRNTILSWAKKVLGNRGYDTFHRLWAR